MQLEELFLNHNKLTFVPEVLADLPRLRKLSLSNNSIMAFPVNIDKARVCV
jgi:Leucine-rich repeat (LRR) protein